MKNKISYIKLGLLMLLGAFIGVMGNIVISFSGDGMTELTEGIQKVLSQTGLMIESVLVVTISAVVISIYLYMRRLWKKEEGAEDEVADCYGEKFESWAQIGIMIINMSSGMILILGCVLFPGNMMPNSSKEAVGFLMLALVMILGCVVMAVMEIMIYHLMQKRDPQKKGDPSSFSFNKKWLESCDETEKLVIYQAGYKAFSCMQIMIGIGIVLSIFGKTRFGTGNFPLVLLGGMWVAGMLCYGIWKMKGLKRK